MRALPAILLAVAVGAPGCVSDPYGDPLPGRAVEVVLAPPGETVEARWPVAFRRAAEFVLENRSARPVETVLVEARGVRELAAASVVDPPGVPATILFAPHGEWPTRASLGTPGTTMLAPGARLKLRLSVLLEPAGCVVWFRVPE